MRKTCEAEDFSGWNYSLTQIFGIGPKYTIKCGDCGRTWRERIPMIDRPGLPCPSCGTVNILPLYVRREERA